MLAFLFALGVALVIGGAAYIHIGLGIISAGLVVLQLARTFSE